MKPYEKTIRDYKKIIQESCIREEAVKRTVEACRSTLPEQPLQEKWERTSYFEFLYEQARFIKKRWWLLQGTVLAFLWFWMSRYAQDSAEMTRLMGVIAVVFVILIVPELWKNRKHGVGEIELASVYNQYSQGFDFCGSRSGNDFAVYAGGASDHDPFCLSTGREFRAAGQCGGVHLFPDPPQPVGKERISCRVPVSGLDRHLGHDYHP